MKIVKHTNMYFAIGSTFYKIEKTKYPTLYGFLVLKREKIVNDYNEWLKDQKEGGVNDIVFPRMALDDKFFNRIVKETKVKVRCVEIFYDVPNLNNRIVNIMGVGFYNEQIHKQIVGDNPALALMKPKSNKQPETKNNNPA